MRAPDESSIRRLEDELKMFRIMKSRTECNSNNNNDSVLSPIQPRRNLPKVISASVSDEKLDTLNLDSEHLHNTYPKTRIRDDDVSSLGNDTTTTFSRLATSIGGVISESLNLLRGVPADGIPYSDDEDSDVTPDDSIMPQFNEMNDHSLLEDDPGSVEDFYFMNDPIKEQTYGRRIAAALLTKKWYNPHGYDLKATGSVKGTNDQESQNSHQYDRPSILKAWAYFEHVTLPRYIVNEDEAPKKKKLCCKMDTKLERAEPGEKNYRTHFYSPFTTPLSQMGDFGLGVGLYFSSLRYLAIMCFIAGCINIPSMLYYKSDEYSGGQDGISWFTLQGSAICTEQHWVACTDCDSLGQELQETGRMQWVNITMSDGTIDEVTLAKKNFCDGAIFTNGMINYATLMFVLVSIVILNFSQKRMAVKFDEDEQTAQDYSILVANPPKDATDPEEWRNFFASLGKDIHVTTVTVSLNNDLLVRTLCERREREYEMRTMLPPDTVMDEINLARIAAEHECQRTPIQKIIALIFHPFGLLLDIPALNSRLIVLDAKVRGLAQRSYPVTKVFVSFETEDAQRRVLSCLSLGKLSVLRQDKSQLASTRYLFRGEKVLEVREPEEPGAIQWQYINAKFKEKCKAVALTMLTTLCAIVATVLLVKLIAGMNALGASLTIALFNSGFPEFAKIITSIEPHHSNSAYQTSLYIKISAFRWVNTAIIMTIIKPFTSTLTDGSENLLPSIWAIFFAEILTVNVIQLTDVTSHFKRHVLGPRASTQSKMNLWFRGYNYELAERYTNMTKILFLSFWYSAIFPQGFFFASLAMGINYYTDSFSIMYTYKPGAKIGDQISRLSRKYFFTIVLIAFAVLSSAWWSGFPFDQLCVNDSVSPEDYQFHNVTSATYMSSDNTKQTIEFNGTDVKIDNIYKFCNQDMLRSLTKFPFIPSNQPKGGEWMTEEQERLTLIYGWTSVGVCCFVLIRLALDIRNTVMPFFKNTYSTHGKDMGINFSDVTSISTYIPQVRSDNFSYPLIVCSTRNIADELFDWTDPDRPYDYYNVVLDAERILRGGGNLFANADKDVFSKVRHWPPRGWTSTAKRLSLTQDTTEREFELPNVKGKKNTAKKKINVYQMVEY